MANKWPAGEQAREANDLFAGAYDDFNYRYHNTRWTTRLLAEAEKAGLSGRRLLDVGCGTGLSLIPMLRRDFEVTGCDISPSMVSIARTKVGDQADIQVADMRELPTFGSFDLVWAVNDPLNYLLSDEELVAALRGMKRNLAEGGVVVIDLATLVVFRTFFVDELHVRVKRRQLVWTGLGYPEAVKPGMVGEGRFEVRGEAAAKPHHHRMRHFSEEEIFDGLARADLCAVAVVGELDGELVKPLAENVHGKAVYICRAVDET